MAKLIKGIGLGSNFSPRFTDYLDDRRSFDTIQDMKDFAETSIADLYVTVNYEDGNFYQFNKTNSDDPTTGKWRKLESSSSGLAILEDYSKLPTANLKNGETYTSAYYHLRTINVKIGDVVTKDTVVGIMGGDPSKETWDKCSTGAHSHLTMAYGLYQTDYKSWDTFVSKTFNPRLAINAPTSRATWFTDRFTKYD